MTEELFDIFNNKFNKKPSMENPVDTVINTLNYKCKKCGDPIQISNITQDKDNEIIYLECDCLCSKIIDMTISEFIYNFEITQKTKYEKIKIFDNSICNKHNGIHGTKFEYYCPECKKDLCKDCIGSIHTNHTVIDFSGDKIKQIIDDKSDNNHKDIKNLLNKLINVYEEYPCYNTYNNIIIVHNFIKNMGNETGDPNDLFKIIRKKIIKKKIRFPRELKERLNGETIISICIVKKGFDHFKEMMEKDLKDLEILELEENNISNIEPLIKQQYPNLKILYLGKNRLGDINIKYIKEIQAPKLEDLDLFENNFTDLMILKSVEHFINLKCLYIGANKFKKNFDRKYKLSSLLLIGVAFGAFSDETIKYLSNIEMKKLKVLYLSSNNLHSLEFLKNLDYPDLEQIHFMSNYIEDCTPLIINKEKFKKIKRINLKYNNISDTSILKKLVDSYHDLKELTLSENKIDINNKDIKEINKKIKLNIY